MHSVKTVTDSGLVALGANFAPKVDDSTMLLALRHYAASCIWGLPEEFESISEKTARRFGDRELVWLPNAAKLDLLGWFVMNAGERFGFMPNLLIEFTLTGSSGRLAYVRVGDERGHLEYVGDPQGPLYELFVSTKEASALAYTTSTR